VSFRALPDHIADRQAELIQLSRDLIIPSEDAARHGIAGANIGAPDEYIRIDNMIRSAKLYAAAAARYLTFSNTKNIE
jgi:hypothetical protein